MAYLFVFMALKLNCLKLILKIYYLSTLFMSGPESKQKDL